MIKVLVSLFFATAASASPWVPVPFGYGYHAPGLVQNHAGGGYSFQSGSHLGKRSAEPHGFFPLYHYGYHHVHHPGSATLEDGELSVTHPGGGTSTVSGHSLGKRSADPHGYYLGHHGFHGYFHGLPHEHPAPAGLDVTATVEHPNGGTSTVSGHSLGKRSAEPHGYYHGRYLLPFHHGYHHVAAPVKALGEPGTAVHPGGATSYVAGSGPGIGRKRREAEPVVWGLRNGHGGFVGQAVPAHGHGYLHHGYYRGYYLG